AWADAYRRRTGGWPHHDSGAIPKTAGESWQKVDTALRNGTRGMPGGTSLARLLSCRRGVRNSSDLAPLCERKILEWAEDHRERTGKWPTADSGAIPGTQGETWLAADEALRRGRRGLKNGSSLARLLERERGVRNVGTLGRL